MLSVELYDLLFFAQHGVYEGEAATGGNFQVNVVVEYDENKNRFEDLESVISYEALYDIVKKRMAIPSPLLEEVADTIIRKIKHRFNMARVITVSIYKLHPPIEGFQGKAGITLRKKYDQK